ncbi:U3 small nucleolar ribonucleoprotein MPP10 [Pseudolycoriella hygida]|uniref:U3 small nucleolar ribonucleoprotein protein MPP10 n=1 Tax=Pseudolycoriella hygida TaxID=35572 RepID=A0A9Q0S7X2_9DIPT|nr:U3 small nucleolar ribonucleoprotein MPP10 [Pseudolycoriella hygida]
MILEKFAMDSAMNKETIDSVYQDFFKKFHALTKSPEVYLSVQKANAKQSRILLKSQFDYTRSKDVFTSKHIPLQIAIDHMDDEQIWQQLELMNKFMLSHALEKTSRLLAGGDDKYLLTYKKDGEESEENEESADANEPDDGDSTAGEDDEENSVSGSDEEADVHGNTTSEKNELRKSIVDDKFFKLREMEAFLDAEDKKEMRKSKGTYFQHDDEEIDYFNGEFSEDDDGDEDAKYSNFFDADSDDEEEIRRRKREARDRKNKLIEKRKKQDLGLDESDVDNDEDADVEEDDDQNGDEYKEDNSEEDDGESGVGKVSFDMTKNTYRSDSENDDENENKPKMFDNENKSSFELRQERLQNRIAEYEEAAVGEKGWQLKGEITSWSRPQNSLLEEVLEFDSTSRPPPIITEETTLQLEDIIKQRIKDKSWNDVERKYKPVNTPQEFRKKLVLDQEKSKESLAQIYEKEYLKEVEKLDPNHGEKEEEEPKEHKEIRKLMKSLFVKLDALSNFYYTPKPAIPEAKIITNTPAINMEEVAPIGVSDAMLLAPEEVRHRAKGDVMGKSERSSTDKKRERRMKKLRQKSIKIAKEKRTAEKEKQGITLSSKEERNKILNKVTKSRNVQKIKETSDSKSIKSSKAFFAQLQDEVSLKSKSNAKRKASKNEGNVTAKKLKL